ncbi:MAG: DNA mismatch repair protein MutS [Pseudomonadota bacterium]|nr:DNA mismatch repair protein MutS [Pseudomonadota bacterium]
MSFDAADTPMFRQYRELKAQYPDALLFFRMGDFYELFGPDAVWTAGALELTLTARNKESADPVPMCGVPHHAADGYIRRVVEMGRKVAIADQVEDPRQAKGIVRREVVRVVTPGLSGENADAHESAFLVAVGRGAGGTWGLALLDASTGDLRVTEPRDIEELVAELGRIEPREALLAEGVDDPAIRVALGAAPVTVLPAFPVDAPGLAARFGADHGVGDAGLGAVGALLDYASAYLRSGLANVVTLKPYVLGGALGIDEATRRNLELFRPLRGAGRKGTLLGLLDTARTAMGGRLVREWLGAPLLDIDAITARQAAVAAFVAEPAGRRLVIAALAEVADLERIAARVSLGSATPRDLGALRTSLARLPEIASTLAVLDGHRHDGASLGSRLPADLTADVAADLDRWLVDEPPPTQAEGGIVRPGVNTELDTLRGLSLDAKGAIAAMEGALRDETGVSSLKIRHNGVFGYYIEVTKANLHKVPPAWHRKQTIAGGERYITPALKEYEEAVSGADGRRIELEAELFGALRARVAAEVARLQVVARGVAELDVLASFAEMAVRSRWVRPSVDTSGTLDIQAGRHPVVEATLQGERFVPNDVRLDDRGRLVLLTGPNMAGKSTLMRQIAQIVLLAQVGSFVPASAARIGVCDKIFVRVGASDDVAHGQSTFMVEMSETANILVGATGRSLVLLDEIGRGTSTYDGLAIAWAVAEDLHDRIQCRGVFATHYHELAALPETCPHVRNLHVAVTEHGEKIVFLRKLKEGAASGSYGIQCARLAGLPGPVVKRAKALLQQLEKRRPKPEATQLSLFGGGGGHGGDTSGLDGVHLVEIPMAPAPAPLTDPIREAMAALDPDTMSPRDALVALYRLRDLLG